MVDPGIKELFQHVKNKKGKLWWTGTSHFLYGCSCPVAGCINDKPVEVADLEENKELKRIIEKKVRQEAKRPKKGPR